MNSEEAKNTLPVAVGKTALRLQAGYLGERGERYQAAARRDLAELRKLAGQRIDRNPLALENVLILMSPQLGEDYVGKGDRPSPSEEAAYQTLTLFGIHMQSSRLPAHTTERSFAAACGALYKARESASIKPRFDAVLLARSAQSRNNHLRSMISLLRNPFFGFDYGRFATDLRSLGNPKYRSGVLLRWGRDFALGQYSPATTSDNHSA